MAWLAFSINAFKMHSPARHLYNTVKYKIFLPLENPDKTLENIPKPNNNDNNIVGRSSLQLLYRVVLILHTAVKQEKNPTVV
jgi:hypothetical protein